MLQQKRRNSITGGAVDEISLASQAEKNSAHKLLPTFAAMLVTCVGEAICCPNIGGLWNVLWNGAFATLIYAPTGCQII